MNLEGFLKLDGAVRTAVADELEKLSVPMSHTQWRLLHVIAEASRTGKELARVVGFSKQSISRDMLELKREGLVRVEPHPGDGRSRIYTPTLKGLGLEAALTARARSALRRAGLAVD